MVRSPSRALTADDVDALVPLGWLWLRGLPVEHPDGRAGWGQPRQGSMRLTPVAWKSAMLRVATAKPRDSAMAAM